MIATVTSQYSFQGAGGWCAVAQSYAAWTAVVSFAVAVTYCCLHLVISVLLLLVLLLLLPWCWAVRAVVSDVASNAVVSGAVTLGSIVLGAVAVNAGVVNAVEF